MAYLNNPVKIPDVSGKITLVQKGDRTYVQYEIGRTYNPERKSTNPHRVVIGQQLREAPTLMLPNENYEKYFENGAEKMTEKERKIAEEYEAVQGEFRILHSMFDHLYLEFQIQAHKNPHLVVNAYKIQRINKVLIPLKELMQGEAYAKFLEIPEEPHEEEDDDGMPVITGTDFDSEEEEQKRRGERQGWKPRTKLVGLDYSDVALMLTQYKAAIVRFVVNSL